MCATVCPAKVIEIDAAFDPPDAAHPKYPSRFEIDYSRCVFCGLCVEACPEDAIRMVKEVPNLPGANRHAMWLEEGRTPRLAALARRRQALSRRRGHRRDTEIDMTEDLLLYCSPSRPSPGRLLMIVLRHPMQVAMALIAAMLSIGVIYGLLDVHVIAVFQIMIYVGAVMVFMVYAIMLLDVRDPSFTERYSRLLWPGVVACALLVVVLAGAAWQRRAARWQAGCCELRRAAVLGDLPERILALLRADFGAAGRRGAGRRGRGQAREPPSWIRRSS